MTNNAEDEALISMLAAVASEDGSTDTLIEDAASRMAESKGLPADTFARQVQASTPRPPDATDLAGSGAGAAAVASAGLSASPTAAPSSAPARPSPFAEALASRPSMTPDEGDTEDYDEDRGEFADPAPLPETSNPVSDAEVVTDAPVPLWRMAPEELDDLDEDEYPSYDNPERGAADEFSVDPPLPPLPNAASAGTPRAAAHVPERAFDDFDEPPAKDESEDEEKGSALGGAVGTVLGKASGIGNTLWERLAFKDRPLPMKVAIISLPVIIIVGLIASMLSPSAKTPPPMVTHAQEAPTTSAEAQSEQVLDPSRVEAECGPPRSNPALAFSKDATNAWVCPRAFGADGAVLNIFFDKPVVITRISFVPGWPGDNWKKTRVPSMIVWNFGKGNKPLKQAPLPEPAPSVLDVPNYGVTDMSAQILTTVPTDPNPADKTKSRSEASDKSFAMTKLQIFGYVAGNQTIGGGNSSSTTGGGN